MAMQVVVGNLLQLRSQMKRKAWGGDLRHFTDYDREVDALHSKVITIIISTGNKVSTSCAQR